MTQEAHHRCATAAYTIVTALNGHSLPIEATGLGRQYALDGKVQDLVKVAKVLASIMPAVVMTVNNVT